MDRLSSSMGKINPLDIPYILGNIFKSLSVIQLKKCRFVCRMWDEESCKIIQKDSKLFFSDKSTIILDIKLSDVKHMCQSLHFDKSIETEKILRFITENKLGLRFVKCLNLTGHFMYPSSWMKEILFDHSSLVNSLEELSISMPNFFESESFFKCSAEVQLFHKLRRLYIFDRTFSMIFSNSIVWKQNIFRLLLAMPNLQILMYLPFHEPRARMFFEGIQSLPLLRLKYFHINHLEIFPQDLEFFRKRKFCLQYLHLVLTEIFPCDQLNELISLPCVKNTLTEMTLTFKNYSKLTDYEQFHCPENLTRLSLLTYEGKLDIFGSSKYEVELRRLKTLVISLPDEIISCDDIDGVDCQLTELEIYDVPEKFIADDLKALFTTFKRITRLTMNFVDSEILGIIYQYLSKLKVFSVVEHKLHGRCSAEEVEAGLTGLNFKNNNEDIDLADPTALFRRNNSWIGQLKDLTTLTLEVSGLSDLSVIFALSQCESLTSLTLKSLETYDPVFMTDRSIKIFSDSMKLDYLKLENYTDNCSSEAVAYLREKLKWKELHIIT